MTTIQHSKSDSPSAQYWIVTIAGCLVVIALVISPVQELLNNSNLIWLRTLLFAWGLSAILTPFAGWLSFKLNWLDIPHGRKDHGNATPLLGGFAIIASFGLALMFNYHYSLQMKGVGLAGLLIWLSGVIDDKWQLPTKLRLLIQIMAVGILLYFQVHVTFMPDTWWGISLEWLITLIWVIGITNAVNFLDGMDGLAVGMCAIISFCLVIVAVQTSQQYFAFVALAILGSCLGFLPHNFRIGKNARIFLGDSGATFLGFILAATVIMGEWGADRLGNIAVPLLLMAVPIFDMTMTTVIRFGTGQVRTIGEWMSFAGRDHFHHRLASLGIGRSMAVIVIWSVTFFLGISAVVLKEVHGVYTILLLAQGALLFGLLSFFMIYVRSHQIKLFMNSADNEMEVDEYDKVLNSSDKPQIKDQ
jgi:UDP-GlcNAc:undecaprenyl-phosphate/decaprenyl-phosphate GlcNAc-1-phosphate transferase